ncbi:hypothetical protein [Aminobacter anthyllidis]|uniref:hypothetical protein n=1 Tax=Aminobacter anthyllidis TaxID=1035067 RepID=UPI003083AECA
MLSVGPAGLLLLAWRRLATRPAADLHAEKNLAVVLKEFGYARDDKVVGDLAADLRHLCVGTVASGALRPPNDAASEMR